MKESQGIAPYVTPANTDDAFNKLVKRDVVLETLLSRFERTSTESGKKAINSWIAKYSFSQETIQDAEMDEAKKAAARAAATAASVKKPVASPRIKSPKKSPTKASSIIETGAEQQQAASSIGRIPKKRSSSDGVQKENFSNQSSSTKETKKSNLKEELASPAKRLPGAKHAAGQKRKSPQESPAKNKCSKLDLSSKPAASQEREVIDLLHDSDED